MDANKPGSDTTAAPEKGKRTHVQSEIEFPYSDLESAVELVQMLNAKAGTSCEDTELAAWLNQSADGGTFRSRRSAARMFGLAEISQNRVTLTALGHAAVDDTQGRTARAEAFLRPALYAAMYKQYQGLVLPPAAAIERQMEQLGVSPKQKERARQVFQKSATFAGFIDPGSGRFVKPGNASGPQGAEDDGSKNKKDRTGGGGDDGADPPHHPLIEGLFKSLPREGKPFSLDDATDWLEAAAVNLRLVYKFKGSISVQSKPPAILTPPSGDVMLTPGGGKP